MRFLKTTVMFCFVLMLMSCHPYERQKQSKTMQLYVTVDWEGRSLDEEDIEAMQNFRKKFSYIPILQLLNPAYFVRGHQYPKRLTQTIKSTFLPEDTQGLHIHAWKSLTNYCGIQYQHKPSVADMDEDCKAGDCGYTVSLENAYSQQALTTLIACSNNVLMENGFNRAIHFRAGAWQLGPKLINALEANNFVWDSSKIDADLLKTRWHENSGMVQMLRQLHPTATPLDQPYALSKTLMEYPNNAALADYTNDKEIVSLFNKLGASNKKVMVLGFHQETAADFLVHLEKAIPQMELIAKEKDIELNWVSH